MITRIYVCSNCDGEWSSLAMAENHVCKGEQE